MIPVTKPITDQLICSHLFLKFRGRYYLNKLICRKDPITKTLQLQKQLTQNAVLKLSKNQLKCLDKSTIVGTVLVGQSQALDCHPHDLLTEKLDAYRFNARCSAMVLHNIHIFCRASNLHINQLKTSQFNLICNALI